MQPRNEVAIWHRTYSGAGCSEGLVERVPTDRAAARVVELEAEEAERRDDSADGLGDGLTVRYEVRPIGYEP